MRKPANQKVQLKGLRTRLMAMLLAVNVVIIALLSFGAYTFYQKTYIREIASARSDVLSQIAERSRQFKMNMYTLSNLYCHDSVFLSYAGNLTQENAPEFTAYMNELTNQFQVSFNQVNLDFYVVYLSADGIGYCSREVPDDYDYMNPKIKIWYRDIYKAQGEIVDVASYKDRVLNMDAFSAARMIIDPDGKILGYLMINADERQLYQMYQDVIRSNNSNIYVVSPDGEIVSSSNTTIIGFSYFSMSNLEKLFDGKNYMIVLSAGRKVLFTRYYDEASSFTVFEEITLSELLHPLVAVRNMTIFLATVSLLFGILLAWHFSNRITTPIRKLCADVKAVENGNLNQTFTIDSYAEINSLSRGMSQMLKQIRELIDSVHKQEEQKRRIELNWLQAQINPHFMYNTLFSIKCMVDMGNNIDATKMLEMFIQMLHGILSSPDEMVTVSSQMEFLKCYIDLQRYRYEGAFDAVVEYDTEAAECYVPKLLIQPLVENSIQHGININKKDGMITVITRRLEDSLLIEVEDNGIGMTSECIARVMSDVEPLGRPHIGIRNVHDRIRLHYGKPWGIHIESTPNFGTKIQVRLPVIEHWPQWEENKC